MFVSVHCFAGEVMKENACLFWEVFWETLLVRSLQSEDFFYFFYFSLWKQTKETSLNWIPVEIHILFFWIGTVSNTYLKLRLEQFPFPRKEVESHIPHRWELQIKILRWDLKVFPCVSEIPGSKSVIQNPEVLNKIVCVSDKNPVLLFTKQTIDLYILDCKY